MKQHEQFLALERQGQSITAFFRGLSAQEACWKPAPEKWSLLEILCHLLDEEKADFRQRISLTLEDPAQDWPPIDPEAWAGDRDYNTRDLNATLAEFEKERAASLTWLRHLEAPHWSSKKVHPVIGPLLAGDLLASWVAHDLLHLRQAASTRLAYVTESVEPYSTRYAAP